MREIPVAKQNLKQLFASETRAKLKLRLIRSRIDKLKREGTEFVPRRQQSLNLTGSGFEPMMDRTW
jgi:hypothetical protein